jgi:5-methylcytosine-specific restriction endonuclease McrA
VALKKYVHIDRTPAFTRYHVFLRDDFRCGYCGRSEKPDDLTFDHVVPRSRGGKTTWQNIITACRDCNLAKGAKPATEVGMIPNPKPYRPSLKDLQKNGKKYPPDYLHDSWNDYLYWDTELEEG